MRILPCLALVGLVAPVALGTLQAVPAAAEPRVYPVPSQVNFCPAGLQPVTTDGTISCGRPNTAVTWYEMKGHPSAPGRRGR